MNDENIISFNLDLNNLPEISKETKDYLTNLTDEEAHQAALDDPDCPPLSEKQLDKLKPVINLKELRKSLEMTQKEFAETYRLSLASVRDWEQLRSFPDRSTKTYLEMIFYEPEATKILLDKIPA